MWHVCGGDVCVLCCVCDKVEGKGMDEDLKIGIGDDLNMFSIGGAA